MTNTDRVAQNFDETRPDPIHIKMKLADPEQVTALITDAVLTSFWASGLSREWAGDLVRDIHRALNNAGCVIIQVDNDPT